VKIKIARASDLDRKGRERKSWSEGYEPDLSEVLARIARLEQLVLKLLDKVEDIESVVKERKDKAPRSGGVRVVIKGSGEARSETPRKRSALDIIKEQGIVFESDLKSVSNRDKFFTYLAKNGVIVIEGIKERVAVTKEFLDKFVEELSKLENPAVAEEKLRGNMRRFYTVLRESGYLLYDSRNGWELNIKV
jgi:hypothetical protein